MDPTPSTDASDEARSTVKQLLRWSEALAGIARTGLGFTESLYEQERFEEVLHVAADIRSAIDGNDGAVDVDGIVHDWLSRWARASPAT